MFRICVPGLAFIDHFIISFTSDSIKPLQMIFNICCTYNKFLEDVNLFSCRQSDVDTVASANWIKSARPFLRYQMWIGFIMSFHKPRQISSNLISDYLKGETNKQEVIPAVAIKALTSVQCWQTFWLTWFTREIHKYGMLKGNQRSSQRAMGMDSRSFDVYSAISREISKTWLKMIQHISMTQFQRKALQLSANNKQETSLMARVAIGLILDST